MDLGITVGVARGRFEALGSHDIAGEGNSPDLMQRMSVRRVYPIKLCRVLDRESTLSDDSITDAEHTIELLEVM